ncbi:DNA-directed RNA polymerase subunit omega [Pedobacter sp. MR2016-24]|uniref:DNA-directed RNA polymerase subunit omega n=1 Tax=Pedobacter sp. MR2016-24 TaxID=2994466 RepID=UPI0022468F7D|nr:DNA-directed RNA polymerase subunit omega [Pedobacter sp. MR2016-24]MCX2482681.1 DNA-directed RNA polymerase subunit omega [Pedobacter sp. MR2016-24]MDO7743443.1 DNA-directed RNA polymerase subunit omega [Pedobacter sp.]
MNTNKPAISNTTVTRNVNDLDQKTENIYESLVIISKRANQISNNMKEELHGKLAEFASSNDNLEEIFENREQIEISKHYERMPKPSLIAIDEFLNDKIYHRNPAKDAQ